MILSAYEQYKDTEIGWLEGIPAHWGLWRNKYIFAIKKIIAGELGYDVLSVTQRGIVVKDIESGDGQLSMDYSKYQLVEPGDYAMNHMDLLTGYVDISKYKGVTSPDYRVLMLVNESACNETYYLYLLQMGYKQKLFFPLGQGSSHLGRWRLPTDAFMEILYPVPPYNEQAQIARFLDHEVGKIDGLIAEQEKLIALLKEKRQALTISLYAQAASTGDLIRLEHLVDVMNRPVDSSEELIAIGVYNKGKGLFHKEARDADDMGESDFYFVRDGDLIISGQFAWEGSVAMAGIDEDGKVVSHRYPVLKGKKDVLITEFLFSLFTTKHGDFLLNDNSRGAAGRNRPLNLGSLLREKIALPSIADQLKVKELVIQENILIKEIKSQRSLFEERRSALISAAVTGKIDVRGWQPPAAQ